MREQAIENVSQMLADGYRRGDQWPTIAAAVVDAVTPGIRADERREMDYAGIVHRDLIEAEVRERLRTQVEALHRLEPGEHSRRNCRKGWCSHVEVLALLGGAKP